MGDRAADACPVVAWHKNWLNSDTNLIITGVGSDATDCGIGGIIMMDCGGNGIDVVDCTGIVVD